METLFRFVALTPAPLKLVVSKKVLEDKTKDSKYVKTLKSAKPEARMPVARGFLASPGAMKADDVFFNTVEEAAKLREGGGFRADESFLNGSSRVWDTLYLARAVPGSTSAVLTAALIRAASLLLKIEGGSEVADSGAAEAEIRSDHERVMAFRAGPAEEQAIRSPAQRADDMEVRHPPKTAGEGGKKGVGQENGDEGEDGDMDDEAASWLEARRQAAGVKAKARMEARQGKSRRIAFGSGSGLMYKPGAGKGAVAGSGMVPGSVGTAKLLGVGMLKRVEDKVVGYEEGAISHIVNVAAASVMDQVSSLRVTTMDEASSSTESAQSKESSSETSERESLQSEAQESLSTEISARAAGGFSASYGPVTADASAETAFSTTASASSSSSVEFAKTVLQKAAEKVSKTRVETMRRSRKMRSEESSKTGFDNAGGPNRTAIYRWVDEIHESRLLNYGSRMMLEFLVPKPGAVLLWSESEAAEQDLPQPPPAPDISLEDFEPEQVDDLIEEYGLVDPPLQPEPYVFVSKTFKFNDELKSKTNNRANILLIDSSMVVPEGYTVLKLRIYVDATMPRDNVLGGSGDKDEFKNARYLARVGSHTVKLKGERSQGKTFIQDAESDQWVIPRNGSIPVSLTGLEDRSGTLTVVLGCVPSAGLIHKWKVAFLGAVQTEWRRRVSDYEDRLREARRRQPASTVGRNPAASRALERTELKRGTISILTAQHFELFGALDRPEDGPPRIRFREAAAEGRYVEFFERAFEWHNMDYLLYPYFWSHPGIDWKPALQTKMDDPSHEQFLRAGFARVVVPVRPGFEGAVITYLEHPDRAVLWNGMNYEQIDIQSDLHFSIWQAQMELQGRLSEEPEQEGEPWRFRIATEHQIISASAQLPAPAEPQPVPPVNPAP